eukprot:m.119456 g.119456  ORF g.119456 m.119456 type:complete len:485 (+) comp16472_c0_seq2:982-2436(+)
MRTGRQIAAAGLAMLWRGRAPQCVVAAVRHHTHRHGTRQARQLHHDHQSAVSVSSPWLSRSSNGPELVNGRQYAHPIGPVVGICLDGSSHEYLNAAGDAGMMPNLQAILTRTTDPGVIGTAKAVTPSYTNPNNCAIATGAPPAVNGICGNYLFDEETQTEVMMNDPRFLRCETLFAALNRAGYPVTVVTAKDKLLKLLSHGCGASTSFLGFSVENARSQETQDQLRKQGFADIEDLMKASPPDIYDPDASVYCIEAGAAILKSRPQAPSVYYLSTTDYVQHKYAPDEPEALEFYKKLDQVIGCLDHAGAVMGITADHGMNDKVQADGSPDVVYLESMLNEHGIDSRVILPITDPHVVHHGALGGYATIYLKEKNQLNRCLEVLKANKRLEYVQTADFASQEYFLPRDRIGDVVVMGTKSSVLGRTPEYHDLSVVPRLRSHGSLHEVEVPIIFNRPLTVAATERLASGSLRNYDLFEVLLNGVIP